MAGGSGSEDDEPRQSKPRPKAASKPAAKRGKKADESDGGGGSKKGGGGYTKPVKISAELAALVGTDSISRPELTKFFWGYFREHELFVSRTLCLNEVWCMCMFRCRCYLTSSWLTLGSAYHDVSMLCCSC